LKPGAEAVTIRGIHAMDYPDEILSALRDERRFIRLTLSGPKDGAGAEWRKVVIRPVQLPGGRRLQAVFQGRRKQTARSIEPDDVAGEFQRLAQMGFLNIHLQCADGDLHVRITRKGKALISRGKPSLESAPSAPLHDRRKEYPFPPDEPDEFLETIGVMREGRVLQPMREKFRQVNHFLALLSHTDLARRAQGGPVRLVDCGCGRAFLTLAAYHYLREKRGLSVQLTGVDADAEVIARASELRDRLGYEEVQFVRSRILEYEPPERPQAVFSLHACDTATDEAIAQGVKWRADLVLCAPCCQHELHHQVARPEFRAALRHGILRERWADILTDALRAAALRVVGYRTDVIEFVSPGDTPKNLMIRAEKSSGAAPGRAAAEYIALRDFWGVKPCIEKLLGSGFQERLAKP
jgi:hypothetical protein